MKLGVDFDNTIVSYDALFHRVASERQLIPEEIDKNKSEIRNYLRKIGKEHAWTEIQGYVYGFRMPEAVPFPGVKEQFLKFCSDGTDVFIISHKTRYPYLGKKYDLHEAASRWLEQEGFFNEQQIGMRKDRVFFELTKESKLRRVERCNCTHFIDDLPEILMAQDFPTSVERLLFDPNDQYSDCSDYIRIKSWNAIKDIFAM